MNSRRGAAKRPRPGSLLLEVAVALVVAGLLGLGSLGLATALRERAADLRTQASFTRIETALARVVGSDGALPCPDALDAPDGWPDPSRCGLTGLVPYHALGLTGSDTLDGWGGRLFYRAAPSLVSLTGGGTALTPGWPPLGCDPQGAVFARVRPSLHVQPPALPPPALHPAFFLVSAGPNGLGALSASGHRRALTGATAAERTNAGEQDALLEVWTTGTDDRVHWLPAGVLLLMAGCGRDGPGH